MREIEFRGKVPPSYMENFFKEGFVYGSVVLCEDDIESTIINDEFEAHVYTETVGQYTGLLDRNKKKIFEGDILKIQLPMGGFWGDVKQEKIGVVEYESDYGGFIVKWEYSKNQHHENLGCDIAFDGEIIGNIFENKSILPWYI